MSEIIFTIAGKPEALHTDSQKSWMQALGLAMDLRELGATDDLIEDMVNATLILDGGYRILTKEDIRKILQASM